MKRGSAEDGSVLLLGIGLIGVLFVAISVVTDASMAVHQRSVLQARADAAVLAGSQGVDLTSYYLRGATTATTLVPSEARSLALRQIEQAQIDATIDGLEVVALTASSTTVTAVLQAPIRTAFWPIEALIMVESSGRLDYIG